MCVRVPIGHYFYSQNTPMPFRESDILIESYGFFTHEASGRLCWQIRL